MNGREKGNEKRDERGNPLASLTQLALILKNSVHAKLCTDLHPLQADARLRLELDGRMPLPVDSWQGTGPHSV